MVTSMPANVPSSALMPISTPMSTQLSVVYTGPTAAQRPSEALCRPEPPRPSQRVAAESICLPQGILETASAAAGAQRAQWQLMMRMASPPNRGDLGSLNEYSFGRAASPYLYPGGVLRRTSSPFHGHMCTQQSYGPTLWSPNDSRLVSYGSPDFSSALNEVNYPGLAAASPPGRSRLTLPPPHTRQGEVPMPSTKTGPTQL